MDREKLAGLKLSLPALNSVFPWSLKAAMNKVVSTRVEVARNFS